MNLMRKSLGERIKQVLAESDRPLTHSEICKKLDANYRSSVFQALKKLVERGEVKKEFDESIETFVYSL